MECGDIIGVTLSPKLGEISFSINGKPQGSAFTNSLFKKGKFRAICKFSCNLTDISEKSVTLLMKNYQNISLSMIT